MKKATIISSLVVVLAGIGCTKLNQNLNSTLTSDQATTALGANGVSLLLNAAYKDIQSPFSDPGNVFALQEVSTDECLVPTRGGDWDDNGKWRALQQHSYTTDEVNEFTDQFNAFNKMNFDATNVLNFKPSASQAAEARFIRALALYNLLDLYGQFPFRNPGDNLLNAPTVYTGDSAVNFIISELQSLMPDLPAGNGVTLANVEAAKVLMMKCYLNRGAFNAKGKEPYTPTFDPADMQQVITIGQSITPHSYSANYFDNFNPNNDVSPETIFSSPQIEGASTNAGINNMWWATLHYDQYPAFSAQASGWNGFSTVAQTYNLFSAADGATVYGPADTLKKDTRLGGRYYAGSTNIAGVSPGFLIGQQYDQNHVKYLDRKGHLLIFDPVIAPDLKETGSNLEVTGIRIIKYPPDYNASGKYYGNPLAGNDIIIFRYSDVTLMIAEAMARMNGGVIDATALGLINSVRAARGANPLTASITLVNPADVYDPNTLLSERGREFYWENQRRTDLCRFGMFNAKAAYHPADPDSHTNLYPLPSAALASNPNLKQNPGYPDK